MDNKIQIKTLSRILMVLMMFMVLGCKSSKQITSSGELNSKLTAKQLIKEHNKKEPKFLIFPEFFLPDGSPVAC